jgi:protein-tyrosine phosphatase
MIDIHSHIVWGVDDGAKDRSDSLAMLKIAADSGTTDIVATPHSDQQFKFDAKLVAECFIPPST